MGDINASDTPRCDLFKRVGNFQAVVYDKYYSGTIEYVELGFAQQLERELSDKDKEIERLKNIIAERDAEKYKPVRIIKRVASE